MSVSRLSKQSIQTGFPKQQTIWDQQSVLSGAMDALGTITLTQTATDISFASIPSTYSHLQLRVFARTSAAANDQATFMAINQATNSGNNMTRTHYLYGDGAATPTSSTGTSGYALNTTASSNSTFAIAIIDILDYSNTSKNKVIRVLNGYDINGAGGYTFLYSGYFGDTTAITDIRLSTSNGSWTTNCMFSLYGIK